MKVLIVDDEPLVRDNVRDGPRRDVTGREGTV